jgi:hypothetical protein
LVGAVPLPRATIPKKHPIALAATVLPVRVLPKAVLSGPLAVMLSGPSEVSGFQLVEFMGGHILYVGAGSLLLLGLN